MTSIKNALTPAYYAIHEVSAFRGVLPVTEPGEVLARTADGVHGQLHCMSAYARLWVAGVWWSGRGAPPTTVRRPRP